MAVVIRNVIKTLPCSGASSVWQNPRHPYYLCATMCTSLDGVTSYAADVFRFSPSSEKFRAVPSNRPQSSPSKSATSLPDQTSFLFKVRHFRDSPSKRRNHLRSVTSRKNRTFNFTYTSRCKGKGLVATLRDMKAYGGPKVQPHTFLMKVRCRFSPGERTIGTHWMGSWVVPRARRDPWRKISLASTRNWTAISRLSIPQAVTMPTELCPVS
jgi:hypothetical protein